MEDALIFVMVLPVLLLSILMADAAGERSAATYRAENYVVAAAQHAADEIGADPDNSALWDQTAVAVNASARLATYGACKQADPRFQASVYRQPAAPATPTSAAVLVHCPIASSSVFTDDTVTALAIRPLG